MRKDHLLNQKTVRFPGFLDQHTHRLLRAAGRQRSLATTLIIVLFGIFITAGSHPHLLAEAVSSSDQLGYNNVFYINDVRLSKDREIGDGKCLTAQGTCTMLAAAEETNRLFDLDPSKQYLITVTPEATQAQLTARQGGILQIDGTHRNSGSIFLSNSGTNIPSGSIPGMIPNLAQMNTIVGHGVDDDRGSIFWFKGNVTIDLQKRLGTHPSGDSGLIGAVFSFTGKNQILRNFANMYSAEGQIYVGQTAENFILENGEIANSPLPTDGNLRLAVERPLVIVNGAKNVQVRNVEFNSHYRFAAITAASSTNFAKTAIENLTITDCLFSMENSYLSDSRNNHGSGFGGAFSDATANHHPRVNNLVIAGNTFHNSAGRWDHFSDSGTWISTGNHNFANYNPTFAAPFVLLDNAKIYDNDFTQTRNPTETDAHVRNIAVYAGTSVGQGIKIFGNRTTWTAAAPPNLAAFEVIYGQKTDAKISITDNSFVGWDRGTTGSVIVASSYETASSNGFRVEIARNTMTKIGGFTNQGTPANNYPFEAGTTIAGALQNQVSNVGGRLVFPANNRLATVVPSAATPKPGQECKVDVTIAAPAGTGGPVGSFQVDAFTGGDKGISNYLGRVQIAAVSELPKTVSFWYGGGPTGQLLRLQTQDSSGNSSQMSRAITIAEADCAPLVWIKSADSQADPTYNRYINFIVMSSTPLRGGLAANDIDFGPMVGQSPEVYEIIPITTNNSVNTQWKVTVRANASGLVAPYIAAGTVMNLNGTVNLAGSNKDGLPDFEGVLRAPTSFAGPAILNGDTGVAISDLHDTVLYNLPITISAPENLALTVSEPATEPSQRAQFTVQLTSINESGLPTFAPSSTLTLQSNWVNLVPDSTFADPGQAADSIAATLVNHPALSTSAPTFMTTETQTFVTVQAINNQIVDGTRQVSLGTTILSADPAFDGLTLPPIALTVLDDDLPVIKITKTAWAGGKAEPRLVTDGQLTAGQLTQWRFVLAHKSGIAVNGISLIDNATLVPSSGASDQRSEPIAGCSPDSQVPTATIVSPAQLLIQPGQMAVCWTAWINPLTGEIA